jgi:hypothetical protein
MRPYKVLVPEPDSGALVLLGAMAVIFLTVRRYDCNHHWGVRERRV